MRRILSIILALGMLISCTGTLPEPDGDAIVLSSRDMGMQTKTGLPFSEGTSYWFFAFNRSEGTEFIYPAVIQAEGIESAEGVIDFPEGTRSHFGGRRMDFFGLTFADAAAGHWAGASFTAIDGQAPRYRLERAADGSLGDLRRGVLLDRSSGNTAGRLEVDFHHALSRLHFIAARQDSDNLEGIYISSITLADYGAATLDLASGEWTPEGEASSREIYSYVPAGGEDDPAPEKQLTPASAHVCESLVFPSASKDMRIVVKTHNPTLKDEHHENVSQNLTEEFIMPVDLEPNHEYTLSITITNRGVRIIIMTPTQAEWIPNPEVTMDLGQPVTFAGITWADRNLGATFAPANNKLENIRNIRDWDDMRGYYYQFGRNVPYFILKNKKIGNNSILYKDFANNDYAYCDAATKNRTNAPFAILDGNSVAEAYLAAEQNKSWADVNGSGVMPLAFSASRRNLLSGVNYVDISDYDGTKNDAKRFAMVIGGASDDQPWWVINKSQPYEGTPTTWDDVTRQPCPKGWRIPTAEDWSYIMPMSKRTGDITFNPSGSKSSGTLTYKDADGKTYTVKSYTYGAANSEFNYHYYNYKTEGDRIWWAETGGDRYDVRINNVLNSGLAESLGDPKPGYVSQYLCVSPKNKPTRGVLYAIKCAGSNEAYRLKWEFVIHEDMPAVGARSGKDIKPVTMRISRYVSNASERLTNLEDLRSLDWDHPAEVMELPDCGYVYTETKPVLVNAGNETVYACSTIDPATGWYYAMRLKYNEFNDHGPSMASRYLTLVKMRRAYGMVIRPVRDNSIVIE